MTDSSLLHVDESLVVPMEQEGKGCDPPQPRQQLFSPGRHPLPRSSGKEKPGIIPSRTAAGLRFIPGGCQLATVRDELSGAYRK